MKTKIHIFRKIGFILIFFFMQAGFVPAPLEILIDISPNVINIQSSGTLVTVHTNIPYSLVLGSSVCLNEENIAWWKSDTQGFFVAKFDMSAIKKLQLEINKMNTLTLTGLTSDGQVFIGEQDIKIIDVAKKGK